MWKRTYSKKINGISPEQVWSEWVDIENWPKWHADLEYCKLHGEFAEGVRFTLKPTNMKAVEIEISEVEQGRSFTDCTKFPGAKMIDKHLVVPIVGGVKISNVLQVSGVFSFLWFLLVGRNVASSVPDEIESLIDRIKEKQND
ncbi:MAG: SRPBCC family protein [Oligoflexales bacterium]